MTKWTADPGKPLRVLYDEPGKGEVKWKPKKGVWKATFDILGTSHHEGSFLLLSLFPPLSFAVFLPLGLCLSNLTHEIVQLPLDLRTADGSVYRL